MEECPDPAWQEAVGKNCFWNFWEEGMLVQRTGSKSEARCGILMLSAGEGRGQGHPKEPELIPEPTRSY